MKKEHKKHQAPIFFIQLTVEYKYTSHCEQQKLPKKSRGRKLSTSFTDLILTSATGKLFHIVNI